MIDARLTLISTSGNKTGASLIKRRAEHTSFCIERSRLWDIFCTLERNPCCIVKELFHANQQLVSESVQSSPVSVQCDTYLETSIITTAKEDTVGIDAERVDNRVVCHVVYQRAFRASPGLDVSSTGAA